ncbi:carcinoembryonic antigen-related cell adhesion molecule 8-like isoform X4 [Gadus macrocephalus]|nr:carcinoembryonic antigen-related cell adhesion molecule 8-like isoform X4 [Gadus macrocephalus]
MRLTRYITMIKLEMLLNVIFVSGGEGSCAAALNASMPNKMEALSDTCLQIPCSFDSVPSNQLDKNKPILSAWFRSTTNVKNVVFYSNLQKNIYPISIIGNMTEYNCTTVFTNIIRSYADVYYFRAESTSFRATDVCNPLTITVKDSAPAPSIQTLQEGPLTEGSRVTFTCRAIAPCPTQPPHLSWNQSGGPEGRPEPHGDQEPNVRTRRLDITLSDRHDGVRLTCLAEYPVNNSAGGPSIRTAESVVTLNVSYSPKDTQASVSPPTVSLGSVVNLTCTSRANPPVLRFTWFRSSAEGPLNVPDGSLYSFNVSSYRDIYYCVATNPLGNQTSKEITLTVSGKSDGLNVPLIVGGFFGTVFFIGLIISVLWLLKKPSTRQQVTYSCINAQNPICEAPDKQEEEEIHYGEIDFAKRGAVQNPDLVFPQGEEQTSEYVEITAQQAKNTQIRAELERS